MKIIEDFTKKTIQQQAKETIHTKASATTGGANTYKDIKGHIENHDTVVIKDKSKISEKLPWVHIAISNAKRLFLCIHHSTGIDYLQRYLDEYGYKFNRRYFKPVFNRAIIAVVRSKKIENV